MASGIYKIEHVASGKCYVGSAVNITARWTRHKWHLSTRTHHSSKLQRAHEKYGADAFEWRVIELVENKEDLILREQAWIDSLNTISNGYNECPTAGSCLGLKRSPETCKKIALAKTGKKRRPNTPEQRITQSLRQIGVKHKSHRSGWKFSDEIKAKYSVVQKARKRNPEAVAHLIAYHTGRKHSAEECVAKSTRQTGVKRGPNKKRMVPRTEAYRANLSIALTKFYERKRMAQQQNGSFQA